MEKRILVSILMLSGIFAFTWVTRVYALDTDQKNDSQKAEVRLENKFNVSDTRIDSLRKQGLGFGEIDHTLSLAKQMPGGINDQNVNKIVALRQGGAHKEGWGKIARDLNLKMGSANEERAEQGGENRHESTEGSAETHANVSSGRSEGFEAHESAGFNGGANAGGGMGRR